MWVTHEAIDCWAAQPRTTRGGQRSYSDMAIETSLMLLLVFRQPLRQTEGLMALIFELLELGLKMPDHSTVSRCAMSFKLISKRSMLPAQPAHILIDSTGLKLYGAGEWLQEKRGQKSRRSWRSQIKYKIGQVSADGAYDGEPTYETIAQHDPRIEVVIPPSATAHSLRQIRRCETRTCS